MKIKNVIIGSAVAALLMGSSVAMAQNLVTNNTSGYYSAVKVAGICSGYIGKWTGPGQTSVSTPWSLVTKLCGKSTGTCTATLYLSSATTGKYCSGPSTSVSMDLGNGGITVTNPTLSGKTITTSPYTLNIA